MPFFKAPSASIAVTKPNISLYQTHVTIEQGCARTVPIGEIVIFSSVIPLPVKAVRGVQAVRGVIRSLKVVFR